MRFTIPVILALPLLLTSCNRYDLFRVGGYEQDNFSNKADILFVIDNSDSMLEEAESLALNFSKFIENLQIDEEGRSYESLGDAVDNYVGFVQERSGFIDFQFGVTTTDVAEQRGELLGPVVSRDTEDIAGTFVEALVCGATCFDPSLALPVDNNHECGDPPGAFLSEDFLNCECGGEGSWQGNCGTAVEEGIEAVFLAMCQSVPNPPTACFDDVTSTSGAEFSSLLRPSDAGNNEGFLRPGANFIAVIVSDEGDSSRRLDTEDIPTAYLPLFEQFNSRMTWLYIGPGLDAENRIECPSFGGDFGVVRYNYLAFTTGGRVVDIFDEDCDTADFGGPLSQLGELLENLLTTFPLSSVPVDGTLSVLVDGVAVQPAEVTGVDQFGLDVYSDGWAFRSSDNSVEFHGTAIPPYSAEVVLYYLPVDGNPRELPF